MRRILVVGGSIAAVTAAGALRAEGYDGEVVVASAETVPPYSRVPLSKGVLAGTETPQSTALPTLPDDIELRLGCRARSVDIAGREVVTTAGDRIGYDGLVIATGSSARRLAAPGQLGERTVRDLGDAVGLAEAAGTARSAVVVGGGFLGMEVASTLCARGLQVTVVDLVPHLRRLLGPGLTDMVCTRARERGVRLLVADSDVRLQGSPVRAVLLDGSRRIEADLVVTAAGDRPNVAWLAGTHLPVHAEGLLTDETGRVVPGVVAAGDVTCTLRQGRRCRSPHWTNAVNHGRTAALALLGLPVRARHDAYFWTSMFGLDIKLSGTPDRTVVPTVLEGDLASGSALLRWNNPDGTAAAASVNRRIPVGRLRQLAGEAA